MNHDRSKTIPLRRFLMWLTLFFIVLVAVLSIVGAFLRAERASTLFNSLPLIVYWLSLVILLAAGVMVFGRLRRKGGLLLTHLGCLLIILGAMWGSGKGHLLRKELFGSDRIANGYIEIYEGMQQNRVIDSQTNEVLGTLPFIIHLDDFWEEYYWDEGELLVKQYSLLRFDPNQNTYTPILPPPSHGSHRMHPGFHSLMEDPNVFWRTEQAWSIPASIGSELKLPEPFEKVRILRTFTNFQKDSHNTDRSRDNVNPALEVELEWADGNVRTTYVFSSMYPPLDTDGFLFQYRDKGRGVKGYYSDLTILDYENQKQINKVIEVNDPLYYQGYHFTQKDCGYDKFRTSRGEEKIWFTVLGVVSDSGLLAVYLGFWLLGVGIFWQCWFRHIPGYSEKLNGDGN